MVNFGDLTKPATVLIEKISDAIGGIFKPHQIRRIAQAEAEADKIRAVSQIEVTALQDRAISRFFNEEAKKQYNIETITGKALPLLEEGASPQNIEAIGSRISSIDVASSQTKRCKLYGRKSWPEKPIALGDKADCELTLVARQS